MAAGVLFDLERLASGAGRDLLEEVNDSKRLAPAKRERLANAVLAHAEAVSLVSIPASQIDRIGLGPANLACLERALRAVGERAELRFVDGYALGASAPVHERIVRGDATSATVAAASIVAKVTRDRLMARLAERYPGYGFERHKGYGRPEHKAAIAKLGPSPVHRLSFKALRCAGAVVAAPAHRRKPRRASWRELPASEMAAHLLETPTIADRAWTDEPRLPRETRTAFINRVLLRETGPVDGPEVETAATEFET
jgi:ribonuclease HII